MGKRASAALVCALLCGMLLAAGCGRSAKPALTDAEGDSPKPVEFIIERAEETPIPSPEPFVEETPQPDMLFEEDGDIVLSQAFAETFAAQTYTFDHAPRVLIYHTHAREAFRDADDTGGDKPARGSDAAQTPAPSPAGGDDVPAYRSNDPEKTVVRLGELLSDALTERGFIVLHDRTNVELPALSTAYERSLAVMEKYEDVDIYIDLHRNAASVERARDDVVMLDGARTARMFFVVGTGMAEQGDENELPNWRENYTFALSVAEQLSAVDRGLVKANRVKQKAYNQQMGLCLLAEIGHNANLLSDAEHTIPYFADALRAVCEF